MTLKEHFETEKSNHLHQVLNIQLAAQVAQAHYENREQHYPP